MFERIPVFNKLKQHPEVFYSVIVDVGGYGIVWDDELDISCDELWENGISEDKLIEELKLGEISGEELGYIGIKESKSRLGL